MEFLKPENLNNVWASGGDRLYPGDTKYASGWGVEIPPRQYFNQIDFKQDQMLAHLNQRGIAEWDADTEYQADKSYTQSTTGTIYRCVLTHTNQNPELDLTNTYWEIAFANAGDFFTQTESDARFAQLSNNGSDFNGVSFRTNLSLYSKAETYSQAEVNTRTTVASTAQAQAWASNTVLMSALRMAESMQGSNQVLNASGGYQKFPGGLLLQWGTIGFSSGTANVSFTTPFAQVFVVVASDTSSSGDIQYIGVDTPTNTGFLARSSNSSDSGAARYVAIGRY